MSRGALDWARWTLIGSFLGAAVMVAVGRLPWWGGLIALALLFVGACVIATLDSRLLAKASKPAPTTPKQAADRAALKAEADAAFSAEMQEHQRVEAALDALIRAHGVPRRYDAPKGGHMDKREGTYDLEGPLVLTGAELAQLSGPISRLEATPAEDGRAVLTRLSARDRHGGGIELYGPSPERS